MGIQQLDTVLMYLYNNRQYQYIKEIHEALFPQLELDILAILTILNKLVKDGYVTAEKHTVTDRNQKGEIIQVSLPDSYVISYEGVLLVDDCRFKNQPYRSLQRIEKRNHNWTIAKTIAAVLNAIIIILIAIVAVKAQIDGNSINRQSVQVNSDSVNTSK